MNDKPLHREVKLPGAAHCFGRERVAQRLRIGRRAIKLPTQQRPYLPQR